MIKLNQIKGKFFVIVGLIVLYFAFKNTITTYFYNLGVDKAHKDYQEQQIKTSKVLSIKKEDLEKYGSSAGVIIASFMLHTRTLPEFCNSKGVNVNKFVEDYKKKNVVLYVDAFTIANEYEKSYGKTFSEEKYYESMKSSFQNRIESDFTSLSKKFNIDLKSTCEQFNTNSKSMNENISLLKLYPQESKIVTDNYKKFLD